MIGVYEWTVAFNLHMRIEQLIQLLEQHYFSKQLKRFLNSFSFCVSYFRPSPRFQRSYCNIIK